MYSAAAVCERGLDDISCTEIKELIGADAQSRDGVVFFHVKSLDKLAFLCYCAQSLKRVLLLFADGTFKDFFVEIGEKIKKVDLSEWVTKESTLAVVCERMGEHPFTSSEAAERVGEMLIQEIEKKRGFMPQVNLDHPSVPFFLYIADNQFIFGIDFGGFDLAQREYKIFSHAASLKGTVGYGIVRLAGFEKKQLMLSCFTKSAIIEIEAALFAAHRAVNHYRKDAFAFLEFPCFPEKDWDAFFADIDKEFSDNKLHILAIDSDLRNISGGKKNAKIAGIDRLIDFSRIDVEWMDVKFKEGEFDVLIAYPAGRETEQMNKLFHQAGYILNEKGKMVVVSMGKRFEDFGNAEGFAVENERVLERGETKLIIQIFVKK